MLYDIYYTILHYICCITYICYTYYIYATRIHILNVYTYYTLNITYTSPHPGPCPGPVLRPVDPGPVHEAGRGQRGLVALLPQRSQGPR